ncbi:MAG: hypothetical protein ACE5JJ_08385 [Nitrospinota bacterium]
MRARLALLLAAALMAFSLPGCSRTPIEKALAGKLLPSDSNQAVSNYCQSCHPHRRFEPSVHLEETKRLYGSGRLAEARLCLDCHKVRLKGIFTSARRRTVRPHGGLAPALELPPPPAKAPPLPPPPTQEPPGAKKKKKRRWYFFYLL